jgi:hypothetical protein
MVVLNSFEQESNPMQHKDNEASTYDSKQVRQYSRLQRKEGSWYKSKQHKCNKLLHDG